MGLTAAETQDVLLEKHGTKLLLEMILRDWESASNLAFVLLPSFMFLNY